MRVGAAPEQNGGAADRAKIEGLLSEAEVPDEQGGADRCQQNLSDAQATARKAGQ